jgi:hypothetical protein
MDMATITRRPEDTVTATVTALHIKANDVDSVNEETDSEITYTMTAEATDQDTARSPVFSGDYEWEGWIPPAAAEWTVHLRKTEDDSSVATLAITAE